MKYLHSKLRSIPAVAFLTIMVLPLDTWAAMRCDRKWVDVGASTYEVTSRCGDPAFQETIKQPVIGISNSRLQATNANTQKGITLDFEEVAPEYREIERWTYDQGSGRFIREVDFYNGEVIEIRTKDRGH